MTGSQKTREEKVRGREHGPLSRRAAALARPGHAGRTGLTGRAARVTAMALGIVLLAGLAFFLLPGGGTSTRIIVLVNGETLSLPAGTKVGQLTRIADVPARPGAALDLTGDVTAVGGGSPAVRLVNGRALSAEQTLGDGAEVIARLGAPRLEAIKRTTAATPFTTAVKGTGNVVSLAESGSPGTQENYVGVSSEKPAASLTLSLPKERVLERSSSPRPGQKLAALTFDDGPGTHTQEVLDALAAAHVPATFFVLGSSAAGHQSLIAEEKAAGCEVEDHTWSHPDLTKVSAAQFRSEVSRTATIIGGARFLRPPYGASNATVKSLAASMGLRLAFWTVDTLDWLHQDVGAIMSNVKAETKPGAIILMHDGGKNRLQTVAAIPVIVNWLFEQGYTLTTVNQIL